MRDPLLAASRLRDFILEQSKVFISDKITGDLKQFYIAYPEYRELIQENFRGIKNFCKDPKHQAYIYWKDPEVTTDQLGKIYATIRK